MARSRAPLLPSTWLFLPQGPKDNVNDKQIEELAKQGYTTGLAKSLTTTRLVFPLRIWVIDNSGSMDQEDGHRIMELAEEDGIEKETKSVRCTRWDEIKDCVMYHSQLAALLQAPTTFRLMNHPGGRVGIQQFGIAEIGPETIRADLSTAAKVMKRARPRGATPLTKHVNDIRASVADMAPKLQAEGMKVAVILATDGLPTDETGRFDAMVRDEFILALKSLEGLPIWLVIRLCTDEESVVAFYNQLDDELDLSLEVLDDFHSEAQEVFEHNPWLNYALPLHRLREMGYHDRMFDLIDERTLTKEEFQNFMMLLFDRDQWENVPDPNADWMGFMSAMEKMLEGEATHWNPIKKAKMPWIDLDVVHEMIGKDD